MTPLILLGAFFIFFASPRLVTWLSSSLRRFLFAKSIPITTQENPKEANTSPAVDLQAVFSTFDKNGDGAITAQELEDSFKSLGLLSTCEEVASMMEKIDANGDGLIDLEEFREIYDSMAKKCEGESEEMVLKEAFDVFDENRDGLIAVEELGMVLRSLGLGQRPEDCEDMIKKVDMDGDGMVSFEEFKKMMMMATGGELL